MEESLFVQIQCPNCNAIYRIDKAKIPDNGATATCSKCQAKIAVQKADPPKAETEEKTTDESTPITPRTDGNGIVCPKCGFKQVHPFRCYRCGFAFQGQNTVKQNTVSQNVVSQNTVSQNTVSQNAVTQNTIGQNTAQTSSIGPAPQMAKPNPPEEQQEANSSEAEIIVKARFLPLMVLLFFVQPRIVIDDQTYERSWGTHRFKVTPGRHKVSVYYPYFFLPRCGENLIDITLTAHETAYIDYHFQIPLIFLKGSIKQIPAQTGLVPFSPEGPSASAFHRWYTTRAAVITLLILLWPVGLFLLWISDEFSKQTKWILTGIIAFIFILATRSP